MVNKKGKKLKIKNEADLIRALIKGSDYTQAEVANVLNIQRQSLCNKLQRNSFSMHDFLTIAYLCEYPVKVGQGDLSEFNDILLGENTMKKVKELREHKKEIKRNWLKTLGYDLA